MPTKIRIHVGHTRISTKKDNTQEVERGWKRSFREQISEDSDGKLNESGYKLLTFWEARCFRYENKNVTLATYLSARGKMVEWRACEIRQVLLFRARRS